MLKGTIKFYNAGKGFGFVTADADGKDIFLPAATVTASKVSQLRPGQSVEFETEADTKGPKVSKIALLEAAVPAEVIAAKVTVYGDPASDIFDGVLAAIERAGFAAQIVNYVETPLSQDQLRQMSLRLRDAGQSLIRRFDPLFLALQLDDRFIGEQDFWTGVIEHPVLINGPILLHAGRVRICKSAQEVKAFLENGAEVSSQKPKGLSPRMAALLRGEPGAALPDPVQKLRDIPAEAKAAPKVEVKLVVPSRAPKVAAKPAPLKPVKKAVKPKSTAVAAKKKAPAKTAKKKVAAKKPTAAKPAKARKKK